MTGRRPEPEVIVEPSAHRLAESTAARAVAVLSAAVNTRGEAQLALTGGGIVEAVFGELAARRDDVDWSRVELWWGDERYVAPDSDERNDKAAFAAGLSQLPFEPARVHRMPADDGTWPAVEQAAHAYATLLATAADEGKVPAFDLLLLGVGPDGHCASLFPDQAGVHERDASVIGVHDSPKPPPVRLSLTFPALDAAREVWFVASGEAKADAVAQALAGADPVHVPSAGPRGRERTLWLLDGAAASKLPG